MGKNGENKYDKAASKTEADVVAKLKALAERRNALAQRLQQAEAQAMQVRTAIIQTEGALNEIADLAKALGVDLAKHFPAAQAAATTAPPPPSPSPAPTPDDKDGPAPDNVREIQTPPAV